MIYTDKDFECFTTRVSRSCLTYYNARTSYTDKFLWLVIMVVCAGTAVWMIRDNFNDWQNNKVGLCLVMESIFIHCQLP